jgi:hypothetical protein
MTDLTDNEISELVSSAFIRDGVPFSGFTIRRFPGETIVVVEVTEDNFAAGLSVATTLDTQLPRGFVTIKKIHNDTTPSALSRAHSLVDPRINHLIEVLNARSRTSEQQPSLRYIRDVSQTLNVATSRRHHLIFGRRGVGKTALMLETKRVVESRGGTILWINVQTIRNLSAYDAFLTTAARICEIPNLTYAGRLSKPLSVERSSKIQQRIIALLDAGANKQQVDRLIPELHQIIKLFGQETQADLYLFLDDIHYMAMKEQPLYLDMIHSITRDNAVWIKAAGIKHQSRWFMDDPPTGLQTGHDAAIINLDVTLEQPAKAKQFLSDILKTYTDEVKLGSVLGTISREAFDRLVLASGGVPRDFLVLSATAIQVARQRPKAKTAGVQDVNEAAGQIAQTKLQELEDDAASSLEKADSRVSALNTLREFLLIQRQVTYFRIDFQDKEAHPKEYELMQSLMDLRLIHLINAGLSDEREAGRRSEVYMLDLSQFSGTRFRRNLKVLDFTKQFLVLKDTGGSGAARTGETPKKLLSILRRGPLFELSQLSSSTSQRVATA